MQQVPFQQRFVMENILNFEPLWQARDVVDTSSAVIRDLRLQILHLFLDNQETSQVLPANPDGTCTLFLANFQTRILLTTTKILSIRS
jgi:hypothetical protein